MLAKENGVDVGKLVCCVLPYGTGNDLARVSGWGGGPSGKTYSNFDNIIKEICLNTKEQNFNVWSVLVKFRSGGAAFEVDAKTRKFKEKHETIFERYMINYSGLGEDGRVGVEFEMKRTGNKCCNDLIYGYIGVKNMICCCFRPAIISN